MSVCVCVTIDLIANIFGTAHHINLKFCNLMVKVIVQLYNKIVQLKVFLVTRRGR